jgi:hypothetical protein
MPTIKAKVRVHNVSENHFGPENSKSGERVQMSPVYSDDPQSENYSFSQATPSGAIELNITNPDAFGFFEVNKEYVVDFTPA